jgi:arginyl-tRNA synthetase
LNVQSEKSEDLATTRQHVVSAMLAGNSKGISELGVSFNEFAMSEKAVEMGFIQVGESLKGLSDDTKAQIKLALLMDAANVDNAESLGRLNEFLDTKQVRMG